MKLCYDNIAICSHPTGYKINVQVLKCELVDKNTVLVAPSFGVGMDYELPRQSWCLKPIPGMAKNLLILDKKIIEGLDVCLEGFIKP